MKTEVKDLGKNVVEVDITIDAKTAGAEYDKACKQLAQRVNIDGFRKGKAPKAIVEKHVGVDMIQRQALEAILPKVFADVVTTNPVISVGIIDNSFQRYYYSENSFYATKKLILTEKSGNILKEISANEIIKVVITVIPAKAVANILENITPLYTFL